MVFSATRRASSLVSEFKQRFWAYAALAALALSFSLAACLLWDQRETLKAHVGRDASESVWMVFLRPQADKDAVEQVIRSFAGIRSIRFVSKEEAYETIQKEPQLSRSLTLTGRNPFPDAFEVTWDPAVARTYFLDHTADKVREADGVDSVDYDRSRVERLNALQRALHQLEFALLAVFWVAAVCLVILAGRLLFFPEGPLPERRILACCLAGLAGGAGGTALSQRFIPAFYGWTLWLGLGVGLLTALLQANAQDA
jgi:cell division protein FtsX